MLEVVEPINEEEALLAQINKIKAILDEMFCDYSEKGINEEGIYLSHQLDQLIIKYMSLKKST